MSRDDEFWQAFYAGRRRAMNEAGPAQGETSPQATGTEAISFFRAIQTQAEEVANLTGVPVRDVIRAAIANHVAAVRLSYLRGGHVLYVEANGQSKRLKLPKAPG